MEITHKFLLSLAKSNSDLEILLGGLIKVSPVICLPVKRVYEVYSLRFEMQKNVSKRNLISGWESLIQILLSLKDKKTQIQLVTIIGEDFGITIFINQRTENILGTLKFRDQKIIAHKELNEEGKIRGTWTDGTQFFQKGIRLN